MTVGEREIRTCPVCGSSIDSAADKALTKDGFELVSCRTCGLLMRASLPAAADLREIYGPEYFRYAPDKPVDGYANYLGDAEWHRQLAHRRLALMERFAPERGRLLDVGTAAGFFVAEAAARGWYAQGIDIALPIVEWGRQELGVPVYVGEISGVEEYGAFAAVTMWDYIEHSLDPAGEITRSGELLAPGGILAISTGDVDSITARLSRSHWHLLTPRHHNFFFSASTLRRLLDRSGFEVAWQGYSGARYSIAHLAYKLDRALRLGVTAATAQRVGASRIGRYSLPLNLFDIVTVVARKRAWQPGCASTGAPIDYYGERAS